SEQNAAATLAGAMKKGDFGFGGSGAVKSFADDAAFRAFLRSRDTGSQIIRVNTVSSITKLYAPALVMKAQDTWTVLSAVNVIGNGIERHGVRIAVGSENGLSDTEFELWTDKNTTVDANGFIKKASPIARLSGGPEKMADDYLDGFALSGYAAVNCEAAGVSAERVSVGVYKVTGALGFAQEGWNIEVPQDVNGNRLCFVSTSTGKDGTIYVKVSKRRFDIDTAAIVAGEPMDIPAGRWIDLRLEMPVSEVEEAPQAVEETAALENANVDPI
ncbi:phage tail fiber protein, partial [Serratia marcescens]|uniref:phage tail fiber protein n=1 Tax=Serratia marcescens TaxID=615 RepID=UPI00402B7B03